MSYSLQKKFCTFLIFIFFISACHMEQNAFVKFVHAGKFFENKFFISSKLFYSFLIKKILFQATQMSPWPKCKQFSTWWRKISFDSREDHNPGIFLIVWIYFRLKNCGVVIFCKKKLLSIFLKLHVRFFLPNFQTML